jgi:hypothetical protein
MSRSGLHALVGSDLGLGFNVAFVLMRLLPYVPQPR